LSERLQQAADLPFARSQNESNARRLRESQKFRRVCPYSHKSLVTATTRLQRTCCRDDTFCGGLARGILHPAAATGTIKPT